LYKGVVLLLLCIPQTLFSSNYLYNDFTDTSYTYKVETTLDVKSDNLPLDFFDTDWKDYNKRRKNNYAFGLVNFEAMRKYNDFVIGVFLQKNADAYMNDILIETLYESDKNFFAILSNKNLYKNLDAGPILGRVNSFESSGLFFQKQFLLKDNHHFLLKLKLHLAKELDDVSVKGTSTEDSFKGKLDYYYSNSNKISNAKNLSDTPQGYGYSLDMAYIYKKDKIYAYFGVYNILSYIFWKNISYMHYDFDSQTIYVGEDGYNHYKPFGVGYYKYNLNYTQQIPTYAKGSLNYEFMNNLAFGDTVSIYEGMHYNEVYTTLKLLSVRYRLTYIPENYNLVFGVYHKHFLFEISRGFEKSNRMLQFRCAFTY